MNNAQKAIYRRFKTVKERAAYLSQFEIETRVDIVDLDFVHRAYIGEVGLPITGTEQAEVLAKADAWLKEKMNPPADDAERVQTTPMKMALVGDYE